MFRGSPDAFVRFRSGVVADGPILAAGATRRWGWTPPAVKRRALGVARLVLDVVALLSRNWEPLAGQEGVHIRVLSRKEESQTLGEINVRIVRWVCGQYLDC